MELKETVSLRERMRINLVSAMKKAGLTQVSLADRLDISKGTVNNWIRGNNSPDVDMVPRICKALVLRFRLFMLQRIWNRSKMIVVLHFYPARRWK